jgi:hypothetical protein
LQHDEDGVDSPALIDESSARAHRFLDDPGIGDAASGLALFQYSLRQMFGYGLHRVPLEDGGQLSFFVGSVFCIKGLENFTPASTIRRASLPESSTSDM